MVQAQGLHRYKEFETPSLQKYGLAGTTTIRPWITAAVIARVYKLSNGFVHFSENDQKFHGYNYKYDSLATWVDIMIRKRAVELVEQLVEQTNKLDKKYEVTVDLDERLEQLLQEAYGIHRTQANAEELYRFHRRAIEPTLLTDKYRMIVEAHINDLKDLDNIEEAKKKLAEIAERFKDEDRTLYIKQLKDRIAELENKIKVLELENALLHTKMLKCTQT